MLILVWNDKSVSKKSVTAYLLILKWLEKCWTMPRHCRKNNTKHLTFSLSDRRKCEFATFSRGSTLNIAELGARVCNLGSANECGMFIFLYPCFFCFVKIVKSTLLLKVAVCLSAHWSSSSLVSQLNFIKNIWWNFWTVSMWLIYSVTPGYVCWVIPGTGHSPPIWIFLSKASQGEKSEG